MSLSALNTAGFQKCHFVSKSAQLLGNPIILLRVCCYDSFLFNTFISFDMIIIYLARKITNRSDPEVIKLFFRLNSAEH